MQAILLGGALNDGLGPVEQMRHVPTLPVVNMPLIDYAIELLRGAGVDDLLVNIYHRADQVQKVIDKYLQDGPRDIAIRCSFEPRLVGSANALHRLRPERGAPFLVMMGDVFFDSLPVPELIDGHRASGAAVTVVGKRGPLSGPAYGSLDIDERGQLRALHKESRTTPTALANTGFYIVSPEVIAAVPTDRPYQIGRDLLPALAARGEIVRVVETEAHYERVNSYQQYWQLNMDLVARQGTPHCAPGRTAEGDDSPRIDPGAKLIGPVALGRGCVVEREAVIQGPAVIGEGAIIRRGAQLDRVVVLPRTTIGLAARFADTVLFGEYQASGRAHWVVLPGDPAELYSNDRRVLQDRLEQFVHSTLALILLIVSAPLLLLVALAIRLESPGPIFFTQLRVGQRRRGALTAYPGRVFEFIKFRSMYVDADARLQHLLHERENEYHSDLFVKFREDPRVTRVGKIIRKTSIDELLQLINVFKGDMHLVGNRPLPLYEAAKLTEDWQQLRFSAPAGMTGLWQISGRSDLSLEERIILDNYYAVSRTFWRDIGILLRTVPAVLLQRGSH